MDLNNSNAFVHDHSEELRKRNEEVKKQQEEKRKHQEEEHAAMVKAQHEKEAEEARKAEEKKKNEFRNRLEVDSFKTQLFALDRDLKAKEQERMKLELELQKLKSSITRSEHNVELGHRSLEQRVSDVGRGPVHRLDELKNEEIKIQKEEAVLKKRESFLRYDLGNHRDLVNQRITAERVEEANISRRIIELKKRGAILKVEMEKLHREIFPKQNELHRLDQGIVAKQRQIDEEKKHFQQLDALVRKKDSEIEKLRFERRNIQSAIQRVERMAQV